MKLTTLVALSLLVGCGAAVKTYEPQRLTLDATRQTLLNAIHENAAAQGWKILLASESTGLVEAMSPVEDVAGVATRQRWTFYVDDGQVLAELAFEVQFAPGPSATWERTQDVCVGYQYLRESTQLERIAAYVRPLLAGR